MVYLISSRRKTYAVTVTRETEQSQVDYYLSVTKKEYSRVNTDYYLVLKNHGQELVSSRNNFQELTFQEYMQSH